MKSLIAKAECNHNEARSIRTIISVSNSLW